MRIIFSTLLLACFSIPNPGFTQQDEEVEDDTLVITAKRLTEVLQPVTRDVEGVLVTRNDSPISAELSGRVLDIRADIGDRVAQGDVLASLDCRDYQASLRQASAAVATVRARIRSAQAQVDAFNARTVATKARTAATRARMQAAQARAQTFNARISASGARVKTATARVGASRAQIQSINSRVAATGARVPAAQAQLRLAQNDFKRTQQLRNQQLVPQNQLDQARSALDSARSNFEGIRADRAATQTELAAANANISASQAEVEAARADTGAAKADFLAAKADATAAQADVAASQADVSAAHADKLRVESDRNTVQTELESALAQEEAARIVTERCRITAPFDGQVSQRFLQKGQVATPGTAAFQLIQTKGLEVSARLSQSDLKSQQKGKALQLVVDETVIAIKQRAVIDQLAGNSRTQEVRYTMEEEGDFPIGQTGRVQWQDVLSAVPAEWILRREGGLGVMLVKDGKAHFEKLEDAREGQPVLVDLPEDTLLIDRNRLRVRNGQSVRFPNDEDDAS